MSECFLPAYPLLLDKERDDGTAKGARTSIDNDARNHLGIVVMRECGVALCVLWR